MTGDAGDPQDSSPPDPRSRPAESGFDWPSIAAPSWRFDEPTRRVARALARGIALGMFLLRSTSRR